jgi:glycosyltransferase involved in cell wall biosynthesis
MDPNSQVLSWQLSVALDLARQCEQVVVLTNKVSYFEKPENMEVFLFPKLLFRAPFRFFGGKWLVNFFVFFLCIRFGIKACFIHMNMEWGYRLAPAFRLLGIPVVLWYAHGTITKELERAHRHVDRVVTSTPEGFRLKSNKVSIIGQGIDTEQFSFIKLSTEAKNIITVGRISQRKRIDAMIDVMEELIKIDPHTPFRLIIIGAPITPQDDIYYHKLLERASRSEIGDRVDFVGHISTNNIPRFYRHTFLHLNLSATGSMDKTVLEAIAVGCPVLTSNEAFHEILSSIPEFIIHDQSPESIAQQIHSIYIRGSEIDRVRIRSIVDGKHDLKTFGQRILQEIQALIAS